jgi:hypothetical protein
MLALVPAGLREPSLHERNGKGRGAAETLVIDVVGPEQEAVAYDSLLETPLHAPREDFRTEAGRGNGHGIRNGVHAGADPRTRRLQKDKDDEYRAHAQRQVDYARRVNAFLSVCIILLIALLSCLVTFILER